MSNIETEAQDFLSKCDLSALVGEIPVKITGSVGGDEITIACESELLVTFYHDQDCCESVTIYDICGDWEDLLGVKLVHAEERVGSYDDGKEHEYVTWTFYDFQSTKGSVNVRWCGESNGYYSESVNYRFSIPRVKEETFKLSHPELFI